MPRRDAPPVGAPCWVDLFTSDKQGAQAFYGELFGWKADEAGPEYGGYVNFLKDDLLVAGAMDNDGSSGAPDAWSIYLATPDARATVDAAVAQGATPIVPAMDVMQLGTMAVLLDPGGATIGLWQGGTHKGFGEYAEVDTPSWFELHTRAYDASIDFYRTVFQWKPHTAGDTPEFRYTTLGEGADALAGIMDACGFLPDGVPSSWFVYFGVENADAALKKVVALGGSVVLAAEDTPYGRLAQAADPTGATFKLVEGMRL